MDKALSKLIFPRCGLTYQHVIDVACIVPNKRAAAKKLGVSERQFYQVVKDLGLGHWFTLKKPRSRCLSREDVAQFGREGYTKKDAAYLAGVNYDYFKDLVRLYDLNDFFPGPGYAGWIGRRGYAG